MRCSFSLLLRTVISQSTNDAECTRCSDRSLTYAGFVMLDNFSHLLPSISLRGCQQADGPK